MNLENKKQLMTILLAVGLGVLAAFLVGKYIESSVTAKTNSYMDDFKKKEQQAIAGLQQQVGSLKGDLAKRDQQIQQAMQSMQQQQSDLIKKQMVAVQQQQQQAAGPGGGPSKIADSTVFSKVTPSGKRALTVMIDSLAAVGGLINPGDYVDILADLNIPLEGADVAKVKNKELTSVLFQNIQVLAVGSNFRPIGNSIVYQQQQQSRSLNITLAVDPEEVGLIDFAQKHGQLKLVLRSPNESETKTLEVAAWESLSDYVLYKQGTELNIPSSKPKDDKSGEPVEEDGSPKIEIFRAGQEL